MAAEDRRFGQSSANHKRSAAMDCDPKLSSSISRTEDNRPEERLESKASIRHWMRLSMIGGRQVLMALAKNSMR